jgi:3-isopropylmalate/(R)-2-methylmalate dehydratase small subunit
MKEVLTGSAWVFGGVLDVDWEICPYQVTHELRDKWLYNEEELGKHAMTPLDPDFPKKVQPGDILIGDRSVGYGHDHSHGCLALKGAGVGAVLCETAAPYFLRNCIETGLPILEVPGIFSSTSTGDRLEIDIREGRISNLTTGREFTVNPFPEFIIEMLDAGGVYPLLKSQFDAGILPRAAAPR